MRKQLLVQFVIFVIIFTTACKAETIIKPYDEIEYYRDIFLPSSGLTKESEELVKENYISKIERILSKNKGNYCTEDWKYESATNKSNLIDEMYLKRINVNSLAEFKKMGVDCFGALFSEYNPDDKYDKQHLSELFFDSAIITEVRVVGSYKSQSKKMVDFMGFEKEIVIYYTIYKFQLKSILKGEYLVKQIPLNFEYKVKEGWDAYELDDDIKVEFKKVYQEHSDTKFSLGEKVILFTSSRVSASNIQKFEIGDYQHSISYFINNQTFESGIIGNEFDNNIDLIIRFIKELEKINDTPHFLNRSYK